MTTIAQTTARVRRASYVKHGTYKLVRPHGDVPKKELPHRDSLKD